MADKLSQKPAQFPPSLRSVPSELDRLLSQHGGPADIPSLSRADAQDALRLACSQYPFAHSWPAFRRWTDDEPTARRYWPWIALAADRYRFERKEKERYEEEPKPLAVTDLVNRIETGAKTLCKDLTEALIMRDRRQSDSKYWQSRRHNPDAQFLRTTQWQRIRMMQLSRQPNCEDCLMVGATVKGVEVDHVKVPGGNHALQVSLNNLRTVCKSHHSQKTRHDQRSDSKQRIVGYDVRSGYPIYAK